jgi:TolB-like protein/DNA-binding winged helix-turn-helix (wHTH) protein
LSGQCEMSSERFHFENFELDRGAYQLRRDGEVVRLERLPLDLLFLLVELHGQLVTREQIIDRLWGKDTFVDSYSGINTAVRKIRQALHDDPNAPRFVVTVPAKGYRFATSVLGAPVIAVNGEVRANHEMVGVVPFGDSVSPNGSGLIGRPWHAASRSLRAALVGVAIVLVAGIFAVLQHRSFKTLPTHAGTPVQEQPKLPVPSIPSIAVLPFTNLSGNPSQDYFSDGISDLLINGLSRIPGLFVIARNSSFAYKGKPVQEQQIGKALGVKTVLEGSVFKTADRIRVGIELVDAGSGAELWTSRYDRPLTDILALQDEIVDEVVTTLDLLFKLSEMKLPHPGGSPTTDNIDALDDFLRASEYIWRFSKDDNASARQWVEKAIQLDPKFAWAYAALGWTYVFDVVNQWSANPEADLAHASEMDQKALFLEDSNVDALTLLSTLDVIHERPDQSVADAERAISINPNFAGSYEALANAYKYTARSKEGIRATEEAIRLDPANQDYYGYLLGPFYNNLGRYREAIPVLKRTVAA